MFPNDAGTAHTGARPRRIAATSPTAISRLGCRTRNGSRTSPGIKARDGKDAPLAAGRLPRRQDRRVHGRVRSQRGASQQDARQGRGNAAGGARSLVHSDRGCHCRRPGWLDLMDRYGLAQPRAYQTVTRLDESGTIPSEPGNDCVIISKKTSAACYRYQSPYIDNVLSTIYCDNPRIFDD